MNNRKTPPTDEMTPLGLSYRRNSSGGALCPLDRAVLGHIASFGSALDVLNLAVTSKDTFFGDSSGGASGGSASGGGSTSGADSAAGDATGCPVLRQCMQDVMKHELDQRLRQHKPALSVEGLFPRGAERDVQNRPQIIISGSMTVQAALSQSWQGSDVDIFCTWKAAPLVRQRLIDTFGMICSGACDSYIGSRVNLRSMVDHVEGYAPRDSAVNLPMFGTPSTMEQYLQQAQGWGAKQIKTRCVGRYGRCFVKRAGLPGGSAGGIFRYDFSLERETTVQIIVGKEESQDARDLLRCFDLTICQTNFDGHVFCMASTFHTLNAQTFITAERHAVMENWISASQLLESSSLCNNNAHPACCVCSTRIPDILASMEDSTWAALGMVPYSLEAVCVDDYYDYYWYSLQLSTSSNALSVDDCADDGNWRIRYKFIQKLFFRLQKYAARGITVLNAPEGSLEYPAAMLPIPH
jgi:hypothetical protein